MNKKTGIIIGAVLIALVGAIGLTVFFLQSQQDTRSRASGPDTTTAIVTTPGASTGATTQDASCPTPSQATGVKIDFPYVAGENVAFTQAQCSWSSVPGATKYQVTITEVDDNKVISNEQLDASVVNKVFDVQDGFTYKCDVSAVNSCGTSGAVASNTLLCKVDAAVATPTPPPVTPTTTTVACGSPCTSTANCQSGYVCAIGSNGQGYCSIPAASSSCQASPSQTSCCSTPASPTLVPTVPPTGGVDTTIIAGSATILLIMAGIFMLAL